MKWSYWVINKSNAKISPPKEWNNLIILNKEHKLVETKIFNKIEVAAFAIRGKRTVRWKVGRKHSEYSTKKDCLEIGKKLYVYYLKLKDFKESIPAEIKELIGFRKYKGKTKCPLCLLEIEKDMFLLDARKQPDSIQMGHKNPLHKRDKITHNHTYDNVIWQHRRCNYMQGEDTIKSALKYMIEILKRHKKI